ncbi:hypothetical protein P8Q88_07385 [Qipengyuania sp. XHP0207]|uniref:hypothetical protein n=1 Tax=Qipengyuania sp. XHP0207 TaxID=3038078 RepID=UPI00241DEA0D|nr:hypothetical protein [Qipengyuania sp. XHP0207]MDG5748000.1 hypothetical protein [Qipengyuania sp. XHP0207]
MSAPVPVFDLAQATMLPPASPARHSRPTVEELANRWDAVHEAATAVAGLAQLGREESSAEIASLPIRAAQQEDRAYELVANGIDDLAAVMQPGLRALLSLTASGKDTTAAAMTLWREFHVARAAILALVLDEHDAR